MLGPIRTYFGRRFGNVMLFFTFFFFCADGLIFQRSYLRNELPTKGTEMVSEPLLSLPHSLPLISYRRRGKEGGRKVFIAQFASQASQKGKMKMSGHLSANALRGKFKGGKQKNTSFWY